jgi:hypothetical protein
MTGLRTIRALLGYRPPKPWSFEDALENSCAHLVRLVTQQAEDSAGLWQILSIEY